MESHVIIRFLWLLWRLRVQNLSTFFVAFGKPELRRLNTAVGALRLLETAGGWASLIQRSVITSLMLKVAEIQKLNISLFSSIFPIYLWEQLSSQIFNILTQ